ncbi:MAG: helix-turn-helix transcriptional regulator [Sporocytophaga sp.]|uniref:response regulator transcription factor n=1 Tax=Sporocytophaga sp. TaxID=2231183 RepID=UPI001B1C84D3|nr:helix-turn-helix transcriptional regulator [Sporocytophaga sp.]MBO9701481.1 helix-turn-helix transcriptional regulator [Sporocytophaga sp.]
MVHHQVTAISRDDNNDVRILLIQMTDIHQFKTDDNIIFTIHKKNKDGVYANIMKRTFLCRDQDYILSEREVEVLNLMGQGLTSKEIADSLFVSEHTIYKHRKNMLKKLNVRRSGDLLKKALSVGIV